MDRFGGGAGGGRPDESQIMSEVQTQLRMQMVQEFYQTVRDKCFKMCLTSPGNSLTSGDQKCLTRCMDRYQEATNTVTQAVLGMQGMQ